ncbi:MAG: Asp-tRNA(Asn)/Glu-tRNA(Gln) amidotransferase subunit GatC, partial [Campylobacterota bacterium]|nr:Asp-tRNA(Asn)/Glu-tRNA(Gln) amidotransferase subunit GatC [Campylobacterota bacterium]
KIKGLYVMQVDNALLSKLEKLSYLTVSENKRAEIIAQMDEMIAFVDNLSELDTDGVSDTFAMTPESTKLRGDIPTCNTQINEDIMRHAPHSDDHFFIVPKIIE